MARRLVLIDSNILLIWVLGHVDKRQVGQGRTQNYSPEDFAILKEHLENYDGVLITPHLAAELNSLLKNTLHGKHLQAAFAFLRLRFPEWTEHYVASAEAATSEALLKLGLTDSTVEIAARSAAEILTDDFPLFGWLTKKGINAVNFTHVRASHHATE